MRFDRVGDTSDVKRRLCDIFEEEARRMLSLGAALVNDRANQRRLYFRADRERLRADLDAHECKGVSTDNALAELEQPFQLMFPATIAIDLTHDDGPLSHPVGMSECGGVVSIHLNGIDLGAMRCVNGPTVIEATYHEMLHLSGDRRCDGSVRHHWCGVMGVQALINGK